MNVTAEAWSVLAQYPGDWCDARLEPPRSGSGFSGAAIWRVETPEHPERPLCLRRWPEGHPTEDTLRFIHAVLHHVHRQNLDWVPAPFTNRQGTTWTVVGGRFWELARWMPGTADFRDNPRPSRLRAALMALAPFHEAARSYPNFAPREGFSPAIHERRERVRRLAAGGLEEVVRAIGPAVWPELVESARQAMADVRETLVSVEKKLDAASAWQTPLEPCIRDVWHDHVLFRGDRVTGLIDFGAMRIDCVAVDVARLLGSLARDDESLWAVGLAAYESVRPLHGAEKAMIQALDWSGVVLAAVNWVEWLYGDRRRFADPAAVVQRVREVFDRLHRLAALLRAQRKTTVHLWLPERFDEPAHER